MKKILLISLLALFSLSVFSQIPNYVPANGLVGWWPFNGNANDESGNGNNGTVNGATLTNDRFGNSNMAYSFDGVDDNIEIIDNPSFSFFLNSSYSVNIWFNLISLGSTQAFIGQGDGDGLNQNRFWRISFYSNNNISNHIRGNLSDPFDTKNMHPWLAINQWHMISMVRNYNNDLKMYLDGGLIDTDIDITGVSSPFTQQRNILLGAFFNSYPNILMQYLNGSLDDIGIWNRALTECEIKDLYDSQLGSQAISAGFDQNICSGDQVILNGSGGSAYQWNNNVVDGASFAPLQTGSYVLTGTDTLGCAGTDTVNITVLNPTTSTQSATALDSYTWPLNNQIYTQSGTYTTTIPNAAGCDSVVTLNLTLNFTGISENSEAQISISPNPASDYVTLKVSEQFLGKNYLIYDNSGREIMEGIISQKEMVIKIGAFDDGIYLIKVNNEIQNTFRIIKQ
jgi:hypothetical protein